MLYCCWATMLLNEYCISSLKPVTTSGVGSRAGDGKTQLPRRSATRGDPGYWPPAGRIGLIVDQALTRLAQVDMLKAQLIEMRYFGGMTAEESASVLSISVHVVRRDLRLAQAWLRKEMAE